MKQQQLNYQHQQEIYAQIAPLAKQLMAWGIDPVSFLHSPQGQAMLAPLQEATTNNFEGARTNLIDALGGSGFSAGSGLGAGPLANLFGQEASQHTANVHQLISQATNAGLQAGNMLQGQQAIFNPNPAAGVGVNAGQSVITAPPGAFLGTIAPALIGAAGSALGGFLGKPSAPIVPNPQPGG